jgi:hypothetical protein
MDVGGPTLERLAKDAVQLHCLLLLAAQELPEPLILTPVEGAEPVEGFILSPSKDSS